MGGGVRVGQGSLTRREVFWKVVASIDFLVTVELVTGI